MIFVCVGSREYGFNRLLEKLDDLVGKGEINDAIFAQIGHSTYTPVNFDYQRFIPMEEFGSYQEKADLVITHGGTGAIIGALKMGKQVLVAPRLARYGEHIDDHQTQVAEMLAQEGFLRYVLNMENLLDGIRSFQEKPIEKVFDKPSEVISIITNFINDANYKKREKRKWITL